MRFNGAGRQHKPRMQTLSNDINLLRLLNFDISLFQDMGFCRTGRDKKQKNQQDGYVTPITSPFFKDASGLLGRNMKNSSVFPGNSY